MGLATSVLMPQGNISYLNRLGVGKNRSDSHITRQVVKIPKTQNFSATEVCVSVCKFVMGQRSVCLFDFFNQYVLSWYICATP